MAEGEPLRISLLRQLDSQVAQALSPANCSSKTAI
jgi:hypothetical protein